MMTVVDSWQQTEISELREALKDARQQNEHMRIELALVLDRAELAEDRLRVLREELREARETPFG